MDWLTFSLGPGLAVLMLLATGGLPAAGAPGVAETVTVLFDDAAVLEPAKRDPQVQITAAGQVQLRQVEYISHDVGDRVELIRTSETLRARKTFDLGPVVGAAGGKLYVIGGRGQATFNGRPLTFEPLPYGGWAVADVAAGMLEPGLNTVEFASGFRIHQDLGSAVVAHSFLAGDDGVWRAARGEILARLQLQRYPPRGTLTSPIIDLAQVDDADVIRPRVNVTAIEIAADVQVPARTSIVIEARTGSTPRPEDGGWSNWAAPRELAPARHVQWRATLATDDPHATPVLRSLRLTAHRQVLADSAEHGLRLVRFENARIVRSSRPFTFQQPSQRLSYLRENWNLDEVVAQGGTDLERLVLLRNWVRRQWKHNQGGTERPWDAIDILSAPDGQRGMCVHFGVVFAQSALALGYNARQVILSAHYVAEVFVPDLDQWVLMDVETVQPEGWHHHGTAMYRDQDTGRLMSATELYQARAEGRTDRITQLIHMTDERGEHHPHERVLTPEQYNNFRRFALVPRNNHLDQLEPWEEAHGENHYRSDAYLWWRDSSPEYTGYTWRDGDWHWSVHQTRVSLTAAADAGALEVALDTVTPNFAAYEYRFDSGPWQRLAGEGDDPHSRRAVLAWPLRPGENTLEVRAVNAFERVGAVSRAVVHRPN
jgi:hypothetical protein